MTAPTAEKVPTSGERLARVERLLDLSFNPDPLRIYKPQKNGKGAALSLDLRMELALKPTYVDQASSDGGLFADLVVQKGEDKHGNATFDWNGKIGTKLGMADITTLLVGIRYARHLHQRIPDALRPKTHPDGDAVGMFHTFESANAGKQTTAITLQFTKDGSFFKISKSKELQRSIKLSLTEEFQFEQALLHALRMFQLAGWR